MSRWTASAKWAEGPALDGQRDVPLRLSEGLGVTLFGSLELAASYLSYVVRRKDDAPG